MLKGKAKTDYQREYMGKRRLKGKLLDPTVRPTINMDTHTNELGVWHGASYKRPKIDADGNPIPEYQ